MAGCDPGEVLRELDACRDRLRARQRARRQAAAEAAAPGAADGGSDQMHTPKSGGEPDAAGGQQQQPGGREAADLEKAEGDIEKVIAVAERAAYALRAAREKARGGYAGGGGGGGALSPTAAAAGLSGFLIKQGETRANWKLRHFAFHREEGRVDYYDVNDEDPGVWSLRSTIRISSIVSVKEDSDVLPSADAVKKAVSQVPGRHAQVLQIGLSVGTAWTFGFAVDVGGRTYRIAAETADERRRWVAALSPKALAKSSGSIR